MKKLRINFVLPAYYRVSIGGYRVVYEYANFLADRGHRVTISFPRWCAALPRRSWPVHLLKRAKGAAWALGVALRNRPLVPWFAFRPGVALRLVPDLSGHNLVDADVIVATAWQTATPVWHASAAKGAKYYLIQNHEIWDGPDEEVDNTWRLPMRKIVISAWLGDLGRSLGVQSEDLRHVPNGLDHSLYRIISNPDERPLSIVSLFHTMSVKGVADALRVLERFHQERPDVRITMFGTPARDRSLPDWMHYVEHPTGIRLARDVYNTHSIYLGASRFEGWGLPPAEAMACGCAFVGTDIGGFREFARHEDTALLSPPGDHDAMLANLRALADNPALLRRIQRRGTENIRQFTWERAGIALEQYFLESQAERPR